MTGEHERYEELAVGHVLGGLDAAEDADFRSHLLGCGACRERVAELRDIAGELVAAERDERQRAGLRTEVARRADTADAVGSSFHVLERRHVVAALAVILLLGGALAFWNLHLRTSVAVYADAAEQRGDALAGLATGVAIPTSLADGVSGIVAVDGDHVAFSLDGIPELESSERLVVWLLGPGDADAEIGLVAFAGQLGGSGFAARVDDRDATEVVVTLEAGQPDDGPSGRELLRAELRPTPSG